jgi:hypothetical protein
MLPPLVAPLSVTSPVELLPPSRNARSAEALVRRVVPPTSPPRLLDILVRCLGELRFGRVRAVPGTQDETAEVAAWEADIVLEACELAVTTLDAARRTLTTRALLLWIDGGGDYGERAAFGSGYDSASAATPKGAEESARAAAEDAEELVGHLMALSELRGWLVARRAAAE